MDQRDKILAKSRRAIKVSRIVHWHSLPTLAKTVNKNGS